MPPKCVMLLNSLLQYQNVLFNFHFPEQVSPIGSSINECERDSLGHDIDTQIWLVQLVVYILFFKTDLKLRTNFT